MKTKMSLMVVKQAQTIARLRKENREMKSVIKNVYKHIKRKAEL